MDELETKACRVESLQVGFSWGKTPKAVLSRYLLFFLWQIGYDLKAIPGGKLGDVSSIYAVVTIVDHSLCLNGSTILQGQG